MFGLPVITTLIVFGGFLIPLVLTIWFGLRFRADTDEWWTLGGPSAGPGRRAEHPGGHLGAEGDAS